MYKRIRSGAISSFLLSFLLTLGTGTAAAGTTQTITGDFNGDGIPDALYQPPDENTPTQIMLGDASGQLSIPAQTLNPGYLGLSWGEGQSNIIAGDFTGNGRSDILVQPLAPGGTTAILLTDANGQVHAINQQFSVPYMGLDWSAASHKILVGDFTGNGRQDVLLQTATPGGMNLIAEPNTQGVFNTTGQSWPDGYLGLQWSAQQVTLYSGDFTGNGHSDLLVQVNDPATDSQVPAYALLLADGNGGFTQISQSWGVNAFGADWSPTTHTLSIQDVTGSGVDDIVLMAKDPTGTNYLFLGNQTGTFGKPNMTWTGTESAKTAWANKMDTSQSISVTGSVALKAQPRTTSSSMASVQAKATMSLQSPTTVGDMGGQSGVNGGAATYAIPIVVPPGRAGMQPSLALNYSSRGGNGDVGMGWSLSGLSAITRCPATKAQDNYTQGVTYSVTYDRLCLDGQHLIKVNGTYGQSGSVYRTELDSQVRITLYSGSINSGGAYFEVDYQNGNRAYYGIGTNTQFVASGAAYPLVWAIGQEEDLAGNNVIYNYAAYGSGEYHLSSIVYTGTSSGTTVNSTGNREVDFSYTPRTDPSSVWLAGGLTRQTQLLSQVTTKVAGSEVRQWALNYSTSAATGRSLLASVQECGYAPGSGSLSCLPPDTFTWQNPPLSFGAPVAIPVPSSISVTAGIDCTYSCTARNQFFVDIAGDYDGDGVNEWFYENNVTNTSAVFWGNDPSGTKLIDFSSTFSPQFTGLNQDFLSNGYADAIGDTGNHVITVWTCNAPPVCTSESDGTTTPTGITDQLDGMLTGQFAGDGLPDLLVPQNAAGTFNYTLKYYPNQTKGGSTAPSFLTSGVTLGTYDAGPAPVSFSVIGDLDGNGIPDVLISDPQTGAPVAVGFVSNTTGSASGTSMTIKSVSSIGDSEVCPYPGSQQYAYDYCTFVDINGDGLPDVVWVSDNGNPGTTPPTWHYQINEGGHFGPVVDTGVQVPNFISDYYYDDFGAFLTGDFTNDGKGEILVPVARVSTYCLNIKVKQEGVYQPETLCGDDLYGTTAYGNYTGDDHSVYQFQILKFVEQADGTYVPSWVSNGSAPVTVNLEGGMAKAGDVNGSGLTGIMMLSSNWYDDGAFNKIDTLNTNDGCGGGSTNIACAPVLGNGYYTITPQGGAPDLMINATNGLGAQANWQYDSLTDLKSQGIYTVDQPCSTSNPAGQLVEYYCFTSSMWVVQNYQVSNDTGTTNSYTYAYNDAVYENKGRGFQGFRQIAVTDRAAGTITTNTYNQAFPLSGTLQESQVTMTSGTVLSDTQDTWVSAHPASCLLSSLVYWPELKQSTVIKNGTGGENISTTTTNYTYDGNGNQLTDNATVKDASGTYSSNTSNTYASPDCANWWSDQLQQKKVTLSVTYANPITSNPGVITRTASFSYTPLRKVQEEQDDVGSGFEKDTIYGYDSYGNATSVTLSSPLPLPGNGNLSGEQGFASRITLSDYSGTSGYLVDSITNAAGQTTIINPDPGSGLPLSITDPNSVVTIDQYDAFGRKILDQVTSPIALPAITISYLSPAAVCNGTYISAAYSVTTSHPGAPSQTACYDLLGHELRTVTDGFTSGQPSYIDTKYDVLGRVTFSSEPYFNGQTESGTTITQYDVLNRVLKKTDAENVVTTINYNSLTATTTTTPPDSPAFTTVTITNALGKLLSTMDAYNKETDFRYDVQGNPLLIQDAAGHRTLATYNHIGQKTAVTDPDMGSWSYVYDVAGDMLQQTDAKNQIIEQRFDNLGRMTLRTQPEGTSTWCYDGPSCTSQAPDVGKLYSVTQYDGYQQTYSYDGDGRVVNVADLIRSTTYNTSTTYDSDGRVQTVTYPSSVAAAPPVADAGAAQSVWPGTTVTLNGSGSNDPNGLSLHYQWNQIGGPAVTLSGANTATATFTSGTPGTSYGFQLTVTDGLNTASAATTVAVYSAPGPASGLSIAPELPSTSDSATGNYTLSWTAPTSGIVTGYSVYQSVNGGAYGLAGSTGGSTTSYAFSGMGATSANDTYSYYVAACNPSGCTNSGTASVTVTLPPGSPSVTSLGPNPSVTGNYSLTWNAPGSGVVSSYQVFESDNGGSSYFLATTTGPGVTSYAISGKTNGVYQYYVSACNQAACTASSVYDETVTLPPGAPAGVGFGASVNNYNGSAFSYNGSYTLFWSPPASGTVTGYTVYESLNGGTYVLVGSTSAGTTSYSFGGKGSSSADNIYTYYIAACDQSACTNSGTASVTVAYPPGAPGSVSVSPTTSTNGTYSVSWAAPSSGVVTSYEIAESVNGGGYSVVASGLGTSPTAYTFNGKGSLTSNNTYAEEVAACNDTPSNCGSYSSSASVLVTLPPTAPSSISLPSQSNSDSSFTVSYGAATGVSPTYHVDLGEYDSGSGKYLWIDGHCVSTSTSCNFTAGQITLGTYYAQVYACNQTACGSATQAGNTITVWKLAPPGAPSLSAPSTVSSDSIPLSWSAPSTTTYYNLYKSYEKSGSFGAYTEVPNLTQTSYTDTFGALVQAAQYYVVACNQAGCGAASNVTRTTVQLVGCKTCAPTKSSQTTAPAPSTAPSPSSGSPPSGTGFMAAENGALDISGSAAPQMHRSFANTGLSAVANVPPAQPVAFEKAVAPLAYTAPLRPAPVVATQAKANADRGWRYGLPEYLADADLRVEPASSSTTYARFTVFYTYTSTGYLQQLSNAEYPSQIFWTGNSEDAFNQVETETYGNGISTTVSYVNPATGQNDPDGRIYGISSTNGRTTLQVWKYQWDALGNLTTRANTATGNDSEAFQYDLLNRLLSAQVTDGGGVQPAVSYSYDALGNITYKSDTGTYAYGGGAGPHAVTSVTGVNPGTYGYDADGNMTNRNGTAITWNSENLPTQITQSASNSSSFSYAPDKHRYYQSAEINGVAETTVYVGGYEAVTSNGSTIYRHHLMADGREVAEIDLSNTGSSITEKISYVLTDHLGSTDVVETTDANNNVLSTQYMSFSAWGGRREPGTWLPPVGSAEIQTDHQADRYGFTHQEMLDNVALIHMNGRVYDPNLGRFLSVDPVFEFPTNTQSLNPYSYVLNNPLSMTDPTGYVSTCGTGKTSCPDDMKAGDSAEKTFTPTGSHIAIHITATVLSNGDVAISSNNTQVAQSISSAAANLFGGGNGAQTTQGSTDAQTQPATHTDINSPSNTSTAAQSSAVTNEQAQTSQEQADNDVGHFLNDQELKQFMKMTYSGTQGSDPSVETVYTTDTSGKILIKTQSDCEEAKCDLLNPPSGSAVGGHTHVYPEELRGLRVGEVPDVSQKAAMLARDMPGPGDAAFAGGPGELITPSNAHYSFEGTPQNTIMRYRGGGNANWGKYVQKYWHQGMTSTDNYNLALQYLRRPP